MHLRLGQGHARPATAKACLTVGRPRARSADGTFVPSQRRNGHQNVHAERAAARAAAAARPSVRPSTAPGKMGGAWAGHERSSRDWRQQQPASEKRDWRHNTAFFRDTREFWLFVADRALFAAGRSALSRAAPAATAWGARGQGRASDLWTSAGRAAAARGGSVRTTAETANPNPNPYPNPNPNPNPTPTPNPSPSPNPNQVRTTAETAAAARSADRARRRAARSGEGKEEDENEEAPSLRVWSCGCSSGEELFSARMVYEAWVAPSFEAAGCVAPRFCGLGTDRSPLIIDAARDASAEFSATSLANVPADLLEAFFKELPAPA